MIQILLDARAQLETEGGEYSTSLMAACAACRLSAVRLLVSKGARTSYVRDGVAFNVLLAVKSFPAITQWLLVGRYTEGPRSLMDRRFYTHHS